MSTKPLGQLIQVAYVTNDMDRAIELMKTRYGIERFFTVGPVEFDIGGGRMATLKAALAYVGQTQFEIIEPLGGAVEMYRAALPAGPGFAMRFHHLGFGTPDLDAPDAMRSHLAGSGHHIPSGAKFASASGFFYADATQTLGHHLEYIHMEAGYEALIPRN